MSYHPLEQGEEIKANAERARRAAAVNWLSKSPEQRRVFEEKVQIGKQLDARAQRARVADAVAQSWQGGRTRRVKKRRASRRAKRRTRRSTS